MEGLNQLPMYGVAGAAIVALAFAAMKSAWVGKQDAGTDQMKKIGGHIAEGFEGEEVGMIFVILLNFLGIVDHWCLLRGR